MKVELKHYVTAQTFSPLSLPEASLAPLILMSFITSSEPRSPLPTLDFLRLLQHLCRGFPPPLKLIPLSLVSPKGSHYLRSLKVHVDMQTFARRHVAFLHDGGRVC